jgi:hypothetical protein
MSVEGIIKLIMLTFYIFYLLWAGFKPRVGFAGWYMFANVSKCRFNLFQNVEHGQEQVPFNPWDYLPHSYLAMGRSQLNFFMFFLREIKELDLSGEIELREGFQLTKLRVINTYVVD